MPYKDKETRMQRQRARRLVDTPDIIDTPKVDTPKHSKAKHFDTPADTPDILIPLIDTPLDNISSVFHTAAGRQKLLDILAAFEDSHHPEYMKEVRLGIYGPTLDYINKLSK